jgi:hypothetical protein
MRKSYIDMGGWPLTTVPVLEKLTHITRYILFEDMTTYNSNAIYTIRYVEYNIYNIYVL